MSSIQLKLDSPCHENWEAMSPNEQGRFCQSCQKSVIDFSSMTNREVVKTLLSTEGEICGRVNQYQLEHPIALSEPTHRNWLKYAASLIFPAMLLSKSAKSQSHGLMRVPPSAPKMNLETMIQQVSNRSFQLKGFVLDSTYKSPLEAATIRINGTQVQADSSGHFTIDGKCQKTVQITISHIGYESQSINIDVPIDGFVMDLGTVNLKQQVTQLKDVVLSSALGRYRTRCYTGAFSIRIKTTKTLSSKLNIFSSSDSLKVFPNPASRGRSIQLRAKVNQPGNYVLQIGNAAGQILTQQQWLFAEKNQQQSFTIPSTWAAGMYFVRLLNREGKLIQTQRIVIQ